MIIEIPDHFAPTVCSALVWHGAFVVRTVGIVPAFVHQYSDTFDKLGGRGIGGCDYWDALVANDPSIKELVKNR
jgi:hypothetical protein